MYILHIIKIFSEPSVQYEKPYRLSLFLSRIGQTKVIIAMIILINFYPLRTFVK